MKRAPDIAIMKPRLVKSISSKNRDKYDYGD